VAGARAEMSIDASRAPIVALGMWDESEWSSVTRRPIYINSCAHAITECSSTATHNFYLFRMDVICKRVGRSPARLQPPPGSNKMFRREANGLKLLCSRSLARCHHLFSLYYVYIYKTDSTCATLNFSVLNHSQIAPRATIALVGRHLGARSSLLIAFWHFSCTRASTNIPKCREAVCGFCFRVSAHERWFCNKFLFISQKHLLFCVYCNVLCR